MSRILIVYYSRKGENYWNGSIKNLSRGNTEIVAEMISELTGGDLFEVDTVKSYASDYYTCIDEAKKELREGARPELKQYMDNLDGYDTIFVGYPNWWASIPMPIASFLEEYDFSGKTILPFCSHGGGGLGQSQTAIAKLVPDANMAEGLAINYSGGSGMPDDVAAWLDANGIERQ